MPETQVKMDCIYYVRGHAIYNPYIQVYEPILSFCMNQKVLKHEADEQGDLPVWSPFYHWPYINWYKLMRLPKLDNYCTEQWLKRFMETQPTLDGATYEVIATKSKNTKYIL